jgi:hypothetical protein
MGQHGGPKIHNPSIALNIDVANSKSYNSGSTVFGLLGKNFGTLTSVSLSGTGGSRSFSFNGTTSKIDLGSGTGLNLTGSITISVWINPASFGGNSRGRIYDRLSETFPYGGFGLYLDNVGASNAFAYGVGILLGNTVSFQPNRVDLNTWQHIVTVHSGTNVIFYKNGAAIGNSTTSINLGTNNSAVIGNNASGTRAFDGKIADVKVYSSALSASEIRNLYNSQRKRYGL